ncbi:MAG: hypothetical protein MUE78_12095, partial [Ilumatobacteraceae bacterium]|nr:hypothetical protein [Ilumatobacteraceae bacterium]
LATVLIVAVPLVTGIDWQGPALWLVLALAGLLAVIVATSIERGRARLGEMARRLDELTAGWERMPPLDGHRWLH